MRLLAGRRIVLVSGAPGAGKSTLARPLALALGMPLFTKDSLKESLADSLGLGDGSATWSSQLGGAAMELMWMLATQTPCAVLEANFRPHSIYERAKIQSLGAVVVEVHCSCSPDEAARRYTERGNRSEQHAIHVLRAMTPDQMVEYDRPMAVGKVLVVDTNLPVNIPTLAMDVAAAFSSAELSTLAS